MSLINIKKTTAFVALLLFVVICIAKKNGDISFGHGYLGKSIPLTYLGGVIGILMFLLLSIVSSYSINCSAGIGAKLIWFGQNSFAAMAIHCPIKSFICVLLSKLLHCPSTEISTSVSYSFLCFILTLLLTALLIFLTKFSVCRSNVLGGRKCKTTSVAS